MSFVFDPPLRLKRGVSVRTLGDATEFARKLVGPRLPRQRESILRGLEAAHNAEASRRAARAFQKWAADEGLLANE